MKFETTGPDLPYLYYQTVFSCFFFVKRQSACMYGNEGTKMAHQIFYIYLMLLDKQLGFFFFFYLFLGISSYHRQGRISNFN